MPIRNLILLILVLIIITLLVFGFLYLHSPKPESETARDTNFTANFWPFGKNDEVKNEETLVGVSEHDSSNQEGVDETKFVFKKISSMPIAGYGVFLKERYGETEIETASLVRYLDRITGNIYQTFIDQLDERKLSDTLIPGVRESLFGENGSAVVLRYLDNTERKIETFLGTLPQDVLGADSQREGELVGSYLPENISQVVLSPDASKIFYLLPTGDKVVGITSLVSGENKNQIFDSSFTEWLLEWPNDRMIALTTKPASQVPGYLYFLDPVSKDFEKLLGGINGLTTLTSPQGKLILYTDNNLTLKVFHRDTGEIIQTGIKTLPEKCVWDKTSEFLYCAVPQFIERGDYPDAWYQGEISFSDQIWKIDALTGAGTLLDSPIESLDAINLKLDPEEKYLFFINKKAPYLWMLSLNR